MNDISELHNLTRYLFLYYRISFLITIKRDREREREREKERNREGGKHVRAKDKFCGNIMIFQRQTSR